MDNIIILTNYYQILFKFYLLIPLCDGRPEEFENDLNKYDNQNKYQKMEYIKQVINKLGFNELNKEVSKGIFEENVNELIKLIDNKFRTMFDMKKEEVDKISKKYDTNKKVLGFINKLIGNYSIEIKANKKRIYNKDLRKTSPVIMSYTIENINIIKII